MFEHEAFACVCDIMVLMRHMFGCEGVHEQWVSLWLRVICVKMDRTTFNLTSPFWTCPWWQFSQKTKKVFRTVLNFSEIMKMAALMDWLG